MIIIPQDSFSAELQYTLDCPSLTHKFSQETQNCEIWWNSAYVIIPLLILIVSVCIVTSIIIIWKYRKRKE